MLHKEFWGLVFLAFVVWVFAASTPSSRIENACRPIGWSGNVVVSLSALVMPAHQSKVQGWFDAVEYGCQYTVWRLFYQEAYNKWRAQALGEGTEPPGGLPKDTIDAAPAPAPAAPPAQ